MKVWKCRICFNTAVTGSDILIKVCEKCDEKMEMVREERGYARE